MAIRADTIEPREFTIMFFTIMTESEDDESFNRDHLYDYCLAHFEGDRRRTQSFLNRFFSLLELMEHEQAKPFQQTSEERMRFHPALLETAATLRTRKNGSFPDRRFFAEASKLAETRYADFSFDH